MKIHNAIILFSALSLSACGGGGGSGNNDNGASSGSWGTALLIENNDVAGARSPQLAFDPNGNAVAVWQQSGGTYYNIWANLYTAGSGWGAGEKLEFNSAGDAVLPQVAFDANGNAVAVWQQSGGTLYNIWANLYTAGSGWGTAEKLEFDSAGDARYPQVAVDATGNAVAVWIQSDGTRDNIWANRYVVGSGWGTAELIETDNTGSAAAPQLAIDSAGNALAVWQQSDGTRDNIWSNRYVVGSGWGTAALIESDDSGPASGQQVAVDSSGNAMAVWEQFDGTRINIWANRYVVGTGWGTAELVENDDTGDAEIAQVAMDASGNAMAVWQQFDGSLINIWANRYVAGTGWGTAELIETDDTGDADSAQVAFDVSGNAMAVWNQYDGTRNNIWANRYTLQ